MRVQGFGVGTTAVGMTISVYALARLMMNLPAGILADQHGRKLLLVWGPALTAIGMTTAHVQIWCASAKRVQTSGASTWTAQNRIIRQRRTVQSVTNFETCLRQHL